MTAETSIDPSEKGTDRDRYHHRPAFNAHMNTAARMILAYLDEGPGLQCHLAHRGRPGGSMPGLLDATSLNT